MTHRSEQAGWSSIPQAASNVGGIEESAERIRRQEVSRTLARMALSPEEETAVERMSRSIVDELLRGPISALIFQRRPGSAHLSGRADRAQESPFVAARCPEARST